MATSVDTNKTSTGLGPRIATPMWVKDYAGILVVAVLFFFYAFINNSENNRSDLQIICTVGVGIIVAMGLNLVVGYMGQVALGHAGFVALGGYMLGLLLGRYPGNINWIDYLYTRVDPTGKPLEYKDLTARELALINTNNLLFTIFIVLAVVTAVLALVLGLRYRHVKQTGGKIESHFWQNAGVMRLVTNAVFVLGGIASLVVYGLTIASSHLNDANQNVTDIPWILFAAVLTVTIVLGYLSYLVYKNAATYTGGKRASFWDKPSWVGKTFISTVAIGGGLSLLMLALNIFGFRILQNFWATIILGAVVAGLFGYILALPALRVKGPYLSMVTIAFGLIVVELGNSATLQPVLGGQGGLNAIPYPTSVRDVKKDIIVQPATSKDAAFELFLTTLIIGVFVILTLYLIRSFMRSRWGRGLIALRENEIGAASVGINVTRMKTLAFVLSATLTGIAGVLNSYQFGFIGPNFAVLPASVAYVTMIILGGVGTLYGPVVGAIIIAILPNILRRLEGAQPALELFNLVSTIAPWLFLVLLAAHFATRNNTSASLARLARYLYLAVTVLYGALTILTIALSYDDKARIWTYFTLAGGIVVILALVVWGWEYTANKSPSTIFATIAGVAVLFNSLEFFKVMQLSLGAGRGIGIVKRDLNAFDVGFVLLYLVLFVVSAVITTKETRKLAIRGIAAGFIVFIPGFYALLIGLLNPNAQTFKPLLVELTMYGAILLYFIYLVPKGVGGIIGSFIERYFPTSHGIDRSFLREPTPAPSADAGIPDVTVPTAHKLAFHRERGAHTEVLRVARVTRDFKGLRAVDTVDMKLERGDIHALIGPNGAGKTTLLNLISGLYPLTSGEIVFKGERLDGLKPHQIAEQGISRTFQNLQVFGDMSVIENVMVGFHLHVKQGFWSSLFGLPSVRREEKRIEAYAMELLEFVGLGNRAWDKAKDLPYGYQRLLEIARALAVEPEILLLDEPAAGLNPQEIGSMVSLIRKIQAEGVTVLLIEHHMDLVMEISEEITVLDYGKKISEGTPTRVQNDQKVKDAYFGPEVLIDARS